MTNIVNSVSVKLGNWSKKYLGGMGLNAFGIGFTLPMVENNISEIIKKISYQSKNKRIYIIFDNLERIGTNVSINEVLGMIEKISYIKNVKVIVMTWEDMLLKNDSHHMIYNIFKERVIDKIYVINEQGTDALQNIFGEENLIRVQRFRDRHGVKDLNTLKKGKLMHDELLRSVTECKFFSKELLYICLGIVTEKEECIYKYKINNEADKCLQNFANIIEKHYLELYTNIHHILELITIITEYYEGKRLDEQKLKKILMRIQTDRHNKPNLYLSEQQLKHRLEEIHNKIETENEVEAILYLVDEYEEWKSVIGYADELNNEYIKERAREIISRNICLEQSIEQNEKKYTSIKLKEANATKLAQEIDGISKEEYIFALINKLEDQFKREDYRDRSDIDRLIDSITDESTICNRVLDYMNSVNYIFPVLLGEINEDVWRWCNMSFMLNCKMGHQNKLNFIDYLEKEIEKNNNNILTHRIQILKEKYM